MAQLGNLARISTDPMNDFRAAIAQNAAAYADILLPQEISAGRTGRSRLKSLQVVSVENVGWEVWLWTKQTLSAEPNLSIPSNFAGFWTFTQAQGIRIGGAGLYYYYVDGLDVAYETLDLLPNGRPDENGQRKNLHLALVARSVGKSAGDPGAVQVNFELEGTLGW